MKLRQFLKYCKQMIDENPKCLDMEMLAIHGASGAIDEVGSPCIKEISETNDEELIRDMLYSDYPYDSFIDVYIGN